MTRLMLIDGVLRILKDVEPGLDWTAQERLRKILRNAARHQHGARKIGRILSSATLLTAGLTLAGPEADRATTGLEAAKRRRDGAMVAFLALMPIRKRAFVELDLTRSVEVSSSGITIHLADDMTKNGHPWNARVPDRLEPVLRRYLEEVRPWFLARGGQCHDVVWVMDRGTPYATGYFHIKLSDVTERATGVRVPPHFFRDAAATSLSRLSPKDARLIRPLLGHVSYGVAERHYIQAMTIEAGRDYAAVLGRLTEPEVRTCALDHPKDRLVLVRLRNNDARMSPPSPTSSCSFF